MYRLDVIFEIVSDVYPKHMKVDMPEYGRSKIEEHYKELSAIFDMLTLATSSSKDPFYEACKEKLIDKNFCNHVYPDGVSQQFYDLLPPELRIHLKVKA